MFKTIKRVFYTAIILSIIAIGYGWTHRSDLISSYLSDASGVPVVVEAIEVNLHEISVDKFSISNPLGFVPQNAFSTDSFVVRYSPQKLISSPREIDEITIKNIIVNIEQKTYTGGKSNWSVISEKLAPVEKEKEEKVAPAKKESGFIIKHLLLENITVGVIHPPLKEITATIPKIELYNLGDEDSISPRMIIKIVFDALMRSLLTEPNLKKTLEGVISLPPKILETVVKESSEGAVDVKETLQEIKKTLQENKQQIEKTFESFSGFFKNIAPSDEIDESEKE